MSTQYSLDPLDNISLWTIFEYLPISSYLSILQTCKEWNEMLINSNIFKENKNLITTLLAKIDEIIDSYDYSYRIEELNKITKMYKSNLNVILFLLKKLRWLYQNYTIYSNCDDSLKNNKLVIFNSFFDKNGLAILRAIPDKTLQEDFEIIKQAYLYCKESSKRYIFSSYFAELNFKDFEFCNKILNNFLLKKKEDAFVLNAIKNKEAICQYFTKHELTAYYLENLNIFKGNENLIVDLVINNKYNRNTNSGISDQQLKLFFKSTHNLDIFNKFNKDNLIKFIVKRPVFILPFYNKLNRENIIEICCKNPFVIKQLTDNQCFDLITLKKIIKLVLEKNVKAFRVLSRKDRSIQLNKEMVTNVVLRDYEMIKYVCDLTLQLFEELCEKNENVKLFQDKLLFKKK